MERGEGTKPMCLQRRPWNGWAGGTQHRACLYVSAAPVDAADGGVCACKSPAAGLCDAACKGADAGGFRVPGPSKFWRSTSSWRARWLSSAPISRLPIPPRPRQSALTTHDTTSTQPSSCKPTAAPTSCSSPWAPPAPGGCSHASAQ
eukprot:1061255-Pelagomonas_calceolata.AAC.4